MTAAFESITDQILSTFPAGQYCLPSLLRILEIVETSSVPTACVECAQRPRLFINPQFVAEHAQTPEKLLMLVMHELHHVVLGHTRLFRRVEPIDNLVFDAVINAMLCQLFPAAEYTALFSDFYREDRFPECFLRPPSSRVRWSGEVELPVALQGRKRSALAQLYSALYSYEGATYSELREAFAVKLDESRIDPSKLLGDHRQEGSGSSSDGQLENRTPVLLEELRRSSGKWPPQFDRIIGRSARELLWISTELPPPNNRSRLESILRKVGIATQAGGRIPKRTEAIATVTSPVPSIDRRSVVVKALGGRSLLCRTEVPVKRVTGASMRVHVYLDVSGSIGPLVGPLYAAVLSCREMVHQTIHLFSDEVADVSIDELRRGVGRTTGGTSIECVASHMAKHRVRRALIITDGFVGSPDAAGATVLKRAVLGVALTPGQSSRCELQEFAKHWVTLTESTT